MKFAQSFVLQRLVSVYRCFALTLVSIVAVDTSQVTIAKDRQALPEATPAQAEGLAPIGRLPASNRLDLVLSLPLRQPEALVRLLKEIYDPTTTNYHRYLTPQQFAERFGPSEADYRALTEFAQVNGFAITGRHPNRTLLDLNASVADIEKAFRINLRVYSHPTEPRTFYAAEIAPSIELDVPVLDISGLNNFHLPRPKNLQLLPANEDQQHVPKTGAGPQGAYLGSDFRAAYLPGVSLTGAGQTLGLLEFDGYYSTDISRYEAQAGLPAILLQNVLLDGYNGVPTTGRNSGSSEVSLDIELAMAMAPGLERIIIYEAGPNGLANDVLNRMATDNLAKQLSCSWDFDSPTTGSTDQIFQQMAAQGQSFFDASGDNGAYTRSVPPPDDDPYITLVGGTTLTTTGAGGAWVSETVWNWGAGSGASSGGISTSYAIPTWQMGIDMSANQGSTINRNVPDVALTADNVWVTYNNGKSGAFGGTSCAAPLWAAFTALVNQQALQSGGTTVGFLNPALYAIGNGAGYEIAFHDIVSGNNFQTSGATRFVAAPGYDLCTGWGTPAGQALIDALAGKPQPVSQPSFTGIAADNGGYTLSWATLPGLVYQVQFTTDLPGNVWNNLGNPITASGNTLSFSDVQPLDARRFYRVVLLP
jgi:subtilase family serine protease